MPTPSPTLDRPALRREVPISGGFRTPECVDLEAAGGRYRVFPSEDHQKGPLDPWNMELRGLKGNGRVWPYGGDLLLAYTDSRKIGAKLMTVGVVHQVGDVEVIVRFPVSRLPEVGAILGLRTRRVLAYEEKLAVAERLRKRVRPS